MRFKTQQTVTTGNTTPGYMTGTITAAYPAEGATEAGYTVRYANGSSGYFAESALVAVNA